MAAESVGQIGLDLVVNQKGFNKQMQGITSLAKKAGVALASAFAVKKIVDFGKQAITLGSQLAEVDNVIQQAVPSMEKKIDSFAKNAIQQFGMSEIAAKRFTGVFSSMARGFGFGEESAAAMGTTLTALAADVASFYDTSQDEAFTKLKSIFTGETESLKSLGVVMTQSALDAFALANGFKKTTKNMSESEKVALRYAFVQDKLRFAQGDFARNSGSWANQTRILSEQFNALKASIGQGLINVFLPVIRLMNTLLSKVQAVATAFSNLTARIFGKVEQAASGVVNTTEGIGSATEGAVGGIEDASKAAEKAAKKAKKSLMGFDQINTLQGKDDKQEAGGGVTSLGDMGFGNAIEEQGTKATTVLDKLKDKAKELSSLFTTGFKEGLGSGFDKSIERTKKHVKGIGTSLKDIFTDSKVADSAETMVDKVAKSLGKIAGSGTSIGATFAELTTGSIDRYLAQNKEFIKEKIVSILDITGRKAEIAGNFSVAIADIYTVFRSEKAKQIGADFIAIFSNSFLNITELGLQFGTDLLEAITKPIIDNKDKIKEALDNTLGIVSEVVGGVKDFISNSFESIKKSYDEYIAPAIEKFSDGFSTIFSAVLDAYNTYLAPTIKNTSEKVRELINGPVAELVQKFTDFVGKLVDGIATIWQKTLAPFLAWMIKTLAPTISKAIKNTSDVFLSIATTVSKVAGDILDALGGLIDFIVGVFTGDWKKAWEGIKKFFSGILQGIKDLVSPIGTFFKTQFDKAYANVKNSFSGIKTWFQDRYNDVTSIFKAIPDWFKDKFTEAWTNVKNVFSSGGKIFDGIKDGIASTFKTVVNGLIGGINRIISAPFNKINAMLNTIKDVGVLGVKPFSGLWSYNPLSVPQIPALAQGGFVKANTPQLALIGDNKHEGEVVAPESKLRQLAIEAVRMAGGIGGGITKAEMRQVLIEVFSKYMHFYIGDEDIARHANRGNEMLDLRLNPVKGGY